jgi:AmiR/NasT family two-component response regulator
MNVASLPSVNGRRSAIFSKDRRAVATLARQLPLLGVTAQINPTAKEADLDLCFVDVDTTAEDEAGLPSGFLKFPLIALIGTETPSRLEWMIQREPAAVLMKPLGNHGIFTAIVAALADARRREQDFLKMLKLEERLRARRIVVAAIIKLMKHHGIGEPEAFALLRNSAQQRRMTIESICAEVASDNLLPIRLVTTR